MADNVVRGGALADDGSSDPRVRGVQALVTRLGSNPRLESAALQTVGARGHDGFALAVVTRPGPRPLPPGSAAPRGG